jgi:3'(2'), 5'-bisphosphate nucleotidase
MTGSGRLDKELSVALEAIEAAGVEVMRLYRSFERIDDAPSDITTDADFASQELILQRLNEQFPLDRLCAEETTAALEKDRHAGKPEASRMWIVDPIDGTRGFARKNDEFSIMVGLVEKGVAVLGLVLEPANGRLTYAVRGGGCHSRSGPNEPFERARTRSVSWLHDAVVAMSRSRGEDGEARLLELLGAGKGVKTYSAGIKLAQVARGDADIYLGDYPAMQDWDLCAGCILVEEAGGKATDWDGDPLLFGQPPYKQLRGIAASAAGIHSEALAIVQKRRDAIY